MNALLLAALLFLGWGSAPSATAPRAQKARPQASTRKAGAKLLPGVRAKVGTMLATKPVKKLYDRIAANAQASGWSLSRIVKVERGGIIRATTKP